jgi:hypothetical protein
MTGDPDSDHDPFDFFRRQDEAYRLVPLIYSQGSDNDSDVLVDTGTTTGLNPYAYAYGPGNNQQIGITFDVESNGEGWHDNIHNHLMDSR